MLDYDIVLLVGVAFPQSAIVRSALNTVDVLYVRQTFRRQGIATSMIADVCDQFASEYIGFTEPISPALMQGQTIFYENYLRPYLRLHLFVS